ncbi:MAG: hypothetical protein J1E00_05605 [Oscillospiraceae bacterium]|nr:hypothetical protein [Oscillospiraceae bacterium]
MNTPFFCGRCGKQLFEHGNFCPHCGAPINSGSPFPQEPTPQVAIPVTPAPAPEVVEPVTPEPVQEVVEPVAPEPVQEVAEPVAPEPTPEVAEPVVPEPTPEPVPEPTPEPVPDPTPISGEEVQAEPENPESPEEIVPPVQPETDPTAPASGAETPEDATQFFTPPYEEDATQTFSAPAYELPTEQPALPRKSRAERKKVGALRVIGSSFLCLFAVLFGLSACLVFALRAATSPKAFENILENVRLSELTVPAEDGGTQLLSEYITNQIPESTRAKYQLDVDSIERLMDRAFIREFLETKLGDASERIYSGDDENFLTAREVKRFLKKNSAEVERVIRYRLSDKDIEKIGSYLEDNEALGNVTFNELSMPRLQEEFPFLAALPILTSYLMAGLLATLAVTLLVFAAWVSRFRRFSLVYVSVACLVVGGIHLTAALLTGTLASALHDLFPLPRSIYTSLLSPLRSACLRIGLPLAGVGLLCIVILIVARVISKKRRKAILTEPAGI